MYFYKNGENYAFSLKENLKFEEASEDEVKSAIFESENKKLYFLDKTTAGKRVSYAISDVDMLFKDGNNIDIVRKNEDENYDAPDWIKEAIAKEKVQYLNLAHPFRKNYMIEPHGKKWRVNIVGLGDVGSNLLIGLKLLGGELISEIGIYSNRESVVSRYEMEMNQIYSIEEGSSLNSGAPVVKAVKKENLMDCDMFIFCASVKVPAVGEEVEDVRLIQYESNKEIISKYAKMARDSNFKGVFAVVSDPVDLLCKAVYEISNKNELGKFDHNGLMPEQIEGFGLGVMYARALYYTRQDENLAYFKQEGRAFGPHGKGLIIADSIKNYNKEMSESITEKTVKCNLMVRELGFKPYIAPALSSGTIAILSRIKGEYHYSCVFIDEAYFGIKNKYSRNGLNIERNVMSDELFGKIKETHTLLKNMG
ncbi:MAG: lactate/malate family dehydrogenase [Proteocatella sp.]